MKTYKVEFIENAIANGALKFGQFELKSGRTSPHFFNAGEFYKGSALAALGKCYATAIVESGIEFDVRCLCFSHPVSLRPGSHILSIRHVLL